MNGIGDNLVIDKRTGKFADAKDVPPKYQHHLNAVQSGQMEPIPARVADADVGDDFGRDE
jgi:hypothetical protein